jgi:hypothetical protein
MNRYVETSSGDFLDTKTNLIWKSEPEQSEHTYDETFALSDNKWRAPTIKENVVINKLKSIYNGDSLSLIEV